MPDAKASEIVGQDKAIPSPGKAVLLAVKAHILSVVAAVIVALPFYIIHRSEGVINTAALIGRIIGIALLGWLALRSGYSVTSSFRARIPSKMVVPPVVLIAVSVVLVNVGTTALLVPIWQSIFGKTPSLPQPQVPQYIWEGIILGANRLLAGPIYEELQFRGLLLRALESNRGISKAIFYSSLLFALLHMSPITMIGIFVGSIVMAWTVYRTNSVVSGMIIHSLLNLASFIATLLCFSSGTAPASPPQIPTGSMSVLLLLLAGGICLLVPSMYWLSRITEPSAQDLTSRP